MQGDTNMELKFAINKPYMEVERLNFISKYQEQGYEIKETDTQLQAWFYTPEELDKFKQNIRNNYKLTSTDVKRAIYKVKNLTFADILNMVPTSVDKAELEIEMSAQYFYRGNPYVDIIGNLLGFTSEQLDEFFKTNNINVLKENVNEN